MRSTAVYRLRCNKITRFSCPGFDELSFENTILLGNLDVELSTDFLFKKKAHLMTKPDRIVYF